MVSRWIRSGPRGRNWFDRSSRGKWEIWGDHRGVRHHRDHLRGPCWFGPGYHRCCGGQYFQAECGDKTEEAKISNKFHLTQVWTTLCCCCTINFYAFIVQHLCILLWTHTVHLGGSLTSAKTFALLRRREHTGGADLGSGQSALPCFACKACFQTGAFVVLQLTLQRVVICQSLLFLPINRLPASQKCSKWIARFPIIL